MRWKYKALYLQVLLAVGGVAVAPAAWAADADASAGKQVQGKNAADDGDAQNVLGSVVVTAQRRAEKLQDVPFAITAVSGNDIAQQAVTTSDTLASKVVNLQGQISDTRGSRPRWFLRGIGTNDPSINVDNPVGIYVDDVYLGFAGIQGFPLYDVDHVEVLRGPQGTLWGKNTTGGAINFISRKPSFDRDSYARFGLGSYGTINAEGAVGGPIQDEILAGRASFFCEKSDGWAKNRITGEKAPNYQDCATRFQLTALITENLDANLNVHARSLRGGINPTYPIGANPGGKDNNNYVPPYGTKPQAGDDYYQGVTNPKTDTEGVTATVNWQVAGLTLTSITAFDWADVSSYVGPGGWPVVTGVRTLPVTSSDTDYRQISEELRLASPKTDRLSWIAAYQYFSSRIENTSYSSTVAPAARTSYSKTTLTQDGDSHALFGSAKFNFTEQLSVTGGLRWTYETKDVDETRTRNKLPGTVVFPNPADPTQFTGGPIESVALSAGNSWSKFTYDITPEYQFSKDALVYFRYAHGFRSGAFNPSIIDAAGSGVAYIPETAPEELTSYEIGAKTAWLDNRVTLNGSVFHYDLKNVQLNVQQPNPLGLANATGSAIQNAARGEVDGLELEAAALPTPNLRLNAGLGLLRTKYLDFYTYQGTKLVDASGNSFYRTPETSVTLGIDYKVPFQAGSLTFGTDWNYRSKIYFNAVVQNDPVQEQAGYAIGNARVSYSNTKGSVIVTGYVNNLTDKNYTVVTTAVNNGAYSARLGSPRFYGANVTLKWQ